VPSVVYVDGGIDPGSSFIPTRFTSPLPVTINPWMLSVLPIPNNIALSSGLSGSISGTDPSILRTLSYSVLRAMGLSLTSFTHMIRDINSEPISTQIIGSDSNRVLTTPPIIT